MSKYSIDSTTLTNIANAIRNKDGSSGTIQVSNFATRINAIPTGGGGGGSTPSYSICPIGETKVETFDVTNTSRKYISAVGWISNEFEEMANIMIPAEDLTGYNNYSLLLILIDTDLYNSATFALDENNFTITKTLTPVVLGTKTMLGYVLECINYGTNPYGWDTDLTIKPAFIVTFDSSTFAAGTILSSSMPIIAAPSALNDLTLQGITISAGSSAFIYTLNDTIQSMVTNKTLPMYFVFGVEATSTGCGITRNVRYYHPYLQYTNEGLGTSFGYCFKQNCMNLHSLQDDVFDEINYGNVVVNNSSTNPLYFWFISF